jgi:hypothetical protein
LDNTNDDEEMKRLKEVERLYDQEVAKLNKQRLVCSRFRVSVVSSFVFFMGYFSFLLQALAKKNQEISKIVRQIDEVPTRVCVFWFLCLLFSPPVNLILTLYLS